MSMPTLQPVAFDIETTGIGPDAQLTVAGLATGRSCWQVLNTGGRSADGTALEAQTSARINRSLSVRTASAEADLLRILSDTVEEQFNTEQNYLCGFNGETWRNGFDLPFLRTACARHEVEWPFREVAYADVQSMTARFNTGDGSDLESVYETLVGGEAADPFEDSGEAVAAFESGNWIALLRHNLADLSRTYELAVLAGRYVPKSDFEMKNLAPPIGDGC